MHILVCAAASEMTKDTNSMQYTKADYCFRVVLIGDSGVGKSSIFAKYRELHGEGNNRQKDYFETNVSKRGSKIRLKVMDTQGILQSIFLSTKNKSDHPT